VATVRLSISEPEYIGQYGLHGRFPVLGGLLPTLQVVGHDLRNDEMPLRISASAMCRYNLSADAAAHPGYILRAKSVLCATGLGSRVRGSATSRRSSIRASRCSTPTLQCLRPCFACTCWRREPKLLRRKSFLLRPCLWECSAHGHFGRKLTMTQDSPSKTFAFA